MCETREGDASRAMVVAIAASRSEILASPPAPSAAVVPVRRRGVPRFDHRPMSMRSSISCATLSGTSSLISNA